MICRYRLICQVFLGQILQGTEKEKEPNTVQRHKQS
jgi:hypothetical protein